MKRHRFDPFAFLFGAVFLTIGLTVATGGSGADAVRPFRSWPTAVILIGVVLVFWTVSRVVRSGVSGAVEPASEADVAALVTIEDEQTIESPIGFDSTDTAELDETPPP